MKDLSDYYYQVQHIDVGCNQLVEEKHTVILDDGTELTTLKHYEYDNPNGYTVNRIITTNYDGSTDTELFVHTDDYDCTTNIGQRPSLLVEYVKIQDGYIAEGWLYDRVGHIINSVYRLETSNLTHIAASLPVENFFHAPNRPLSAL